MFRIAAKASWSWGRMDNILSEWRIIESCRQLGKILFERIGNETPKKGTPANDQ